MGIHEIAVKLGFSYTDNIEAEWKLAIYMSGKFQEAAKLFIDYNFVKNANPRKRFKQCLFEVWRKNDGLKRFYIEDPFLKRYFPDLCGAEHYIEIGIGPRFFGDSYGQTEHLNGRYHNMNFATGELDQSKDINEFKRKFHLLLQTVYHECDHIYNEASTKDTHDFESSMLYYMDPAETRAYSKQLAHLFYHAFSGRKFNYKELQTHIDSGYSPNDKPYKIIRVLELMRDPVNFQATNDSIREYIKTRILPGGHIITRTSMHKAFISYLKYMTLFTRYFNENPEHKVAQEFNIR
jgi:hypothetical protein